MGISLKINLHSKTYDDGSRSVMLQCIHSTPAGTVWKRRTLCKVKPEQFDKASQRIKNHPNQILLNALLTKAFHEAETRLLNSQLEEKPIDPDHIIMGGVSKGYLRTMLLRYTREYVAKCRLKGQAHTADKYDSHVSRLTAYLGTDYEGRQNDIALIEVTEEWMLKYSLWLREHGCKSENTIHRRMAFMGTIFNDAQKRGHVKASPLAFLEFKKQKVKKVKLTEVQIQRLETFDIRPGTTNDARNTFLLQFYAYGSRISDALSWKKENIHRREDGLYLEYVSIKTKSLISVRLPQKAIALVEQYEASVPGPYLLPWMGGFEFKPAYSEQRNKQRLIKKISSRTTKVNWHLKLISQQIGFPIKITTHIARHSFATYADSKISDKRKISAALGHSSFATTEVYLAALHQDQISDAMDVLWQ